MPLPNAKPDPAGSNVYRQLNSITLGDLTNEQFDKVYQNVFLNDMSEDELRRLALVGAARQSFSASSSGPIPGTSQVINVTCTGSGVNTDIFTPGPGEVWQVMALSYIVNSGSGTISHLVFLEGNYSGAPGGTVVVSEKASSDAGDNFGDVDFSPLHIDENVDLRYTAYGTFTSVSVRAALIRIR